MIYVYQTFTFRLGDIGTIDCDTSVIIILT